MSVRSIPIYPANLAMFLNKIEFLGAQNAHFERPQHPNAIWNFTPIIFLSTLRIFYVEMATSDQPPIS